MRRFLLSTVAAAVLFVPAVSFAAFERPSDVLKALQQMTGPMDANAEVHSHFTDEGNDVWLSMWAKTSQENGNDILTSKMKMSMTLDVAMMGATARFKGEVRMRDAHLYLRVNEVSGNYEDDLVKAVGTLTQKHWLDIPLDPSAYDDGASVFGAELKEMMTMLTLTQSMQGQDMPEEMWMMLDEMFALTSAKTPTGMAYTLTMKTADPSMMNEQLMMNPMMMLPPDGFSLEFKVDVNSTGRPVFGRVSGGFETMMDGEIFSIKGSGTFQPTKAVVVEKPTDTWSLDALMSHLMDAPWAADFAPFMTAPNPWDENAWEDEWSDDASWEDDMDWAEDMWDENTWEDEWSDANDWSSCDAEPGTLRYVGLVRAGVCPAEDHTSRANRRR